MTEVTQMNQTHVRVFPTSLPERSYGKGILAMQDRFIKDPLRNDPRIGVLSHFW
jgi:hypothetical protein